LTFTPSQTHTHFHTTVALQQAFHHPLCNEEKVLVIAHVIYDSKGLIALLKKYLFFREQLNAIVSVNAR